MFEIWSALGLHSSISETGYDILNIVSQVIGPTRILHGETDTFLWYFALHFHYVNNEPTFQTSRKVFFNVKDLTTSYQRKNSWVDAQVSKNLKVKEVILRPLSWTFSAKKWKKPLSIWHVQKCAMYLRKFTWSDNKKVNHRKQKNWSSVSYERFENIALRAYSKEGSDEFSTDTPLRKDLYTIQQKSSLLANETVWGHPLPGSPIST